MTDKAPPAGESRPLRALLFMMAATLSFTLMAVAGRELAGRVDTFEIMVYRSAMGLAIIAAVAEARGLWPRIRARRLGLHGVRNLSHFIGQNFWFYAVGVIPFSQLFAFEFSVPLWVALLAPVFLAERLTRARVAAAAIGFAGILMVARPDLGGVSPGIAAALMAAIGFTGASIATKLLTRTETTISIMFWLTLMQLVLGLLSAGWDGEIAWPEAQDWPWVVAIGLTGLLAHYCVTAALGSAPATVVLPLDFARLPIIAVIGMLFYDEPLAPLVFVGAGIIFLANFWNVLAETRRP